MFKEFMTAEELYKLNVDKKYILIEYIKYLYQLYNRPLLKKDFSISNRVSHQTLRTYFGSVNNAFEQANIPLSRKNQNISFKQHLLNIKIEQENNCWCENYYASSGHDPYKKIKYNNKKEFIHRVSYIEFKQENIDNKLIMHLCNNPECFNPQHLKIGTPSENQLNVQKAQNNYKTKGKINNPYNYEEILVFIKQNIIITEKNEWIYLGSKSPTNYPIKTINRKNYYLHKLIAANKYNLSYDDKFIARHILDKEKPNTLDLNPDHIFIGNDYDNWKDSLSYKKDIKLSFEIANLIREEADKTDFSIRGSKKIFDINWATKLNVSESTISKIRLKQSWLLKEESERHA